MPEQAKKILVVDDEQMVHEFVHAALEDDGFAFVDAMNGEEGVRKAKAELPALIILDVQMPKKDGFHVFTELRENPSTKSIPIIMLTAINERDGMGFDAASMGDYLGSPPEAFIDKPVDPQKLCETVKKLVPRA